MSTAQINKDPYDDLISSSSKKNPISNIETLQTDNSSKFLTEFLIKPKIPQLKTSIPLTNFVDAFERYYLRDPKEVKKKHIAPSNIISSHSNVTDNQGTLSTQRLKQIQNVNQIKSVHVLPSISKSNLSSITSRHRTTRSQIDLIGKKSISRNFTPDEISEATIGAVAHEMQKVRYDTNKKLKMLFHGSNNDHNDILIDLNLIKKKSSDQPKSKQDQEQEQELQKIKIQSSQQRSKNFSKTNKIEAELPKNSQIDSSRNSITINKPQPIINPYNSDYVNSLLVLPEDNLVMSPELKVASFRTFNDIYNQNKILKLQKQTQVPVIQEILKEENLYRMEQANQSKSQKSPNKTESSRTLLQKELEFNQIQANSLIKTRNLEEKSLILPYLKLQQDLKKKLQNMPKIKIYQRLSIKIFNNI